MRTALYDCGIIGGGPAGLTAALYLRRFQRSVVLFDAGKGRAARIPRIQNLLGYEKGISGAELLRRLKRQTDALGCERIECEARVNQNAAEFEIRAGQKTFRVRKVLLAGGSQDLQPENIANLDALAARGWLRYCPICDSYEYRQKKVAVLACDTHGIRECLFLAPLVRKTVLIYGGKRPISSEDLKSLQCRGVELRYGSPSFIRESSGGESVRIILTDQNPVECTAIYIGLGSRITERSLGGLKGLRCDRGGRLLANADQELSIKGVFGAGDCISSLSQISVAAGQAAIAATAIHNALRMKS